MTSTLRLVASIIGIAAVIIASIHGYYETQQGSVAPQSIYINAIGGTECEPNCLPAMTLLPNFLAAGLATLTVAIAMIVWIVLRLKDMNGALGLIVLSFVLLLTGGGFLSPIVGGIGGAVALRIKRR
jgi:hypothetical protein